MATVAMETRDPDPAVSMPEKSEGRRSQQQQQQRQRRQQRQRSSSTRRKSSSSAASGASPGHQSCNSAATTRLDLTEMPASVTPPAVQQSVQFYLEKCKQPLIPLAPVRRVVSQLNSLSLDLQFMNLGPKHVQVICECLKLNVTVESLDLRSNGINSAAAASIADLARNNPCIQSINLSENSASGMGCHSLGEMLASNCGLRELDVSDNNLGDEDARALANGLCKNYQLLRLRLGRNGIEVEGSKQLARTLVENDTLQELDLSWNHIRGKGGIAIARALKVNTGLVSLDLSWNGLGYEGCIALEEAISYNRYLKELDITANRINWEGAQLIAKGLKRNAALTVLKIGLNTLTMTGVMDILRAVDDDSSSVRHVDFEGQIISSKILFKIETISRRRPFTCRHESVIDSEDVLGTRAEVKDDPLRLLFDFLSSRAIRIVDLYRMIDKENRQFCSRSKFIRSLKRMKVPLTEMELLRVTQRIDPKKTGKISYQMLAKGLRSLRVQLRDDEKKRQAQERREQADQKRLLDQVGELSLDANAAQAGAAAKRRRSQAARLDASGRTLYAPTPLGITERVFQSPSPLGGSIGGGGGFGSSAAFYYTQSGQGGAQTSASSRPLSLPPISAGGRGHSGASAAASRASTLTPTSRLSRRARRRQDEEEEEELAYAREARDYKAPTAVTFTDI